MRNKTVGKSKGGFAEHKVVLNYWKNNYDPYYRSGKERSEFLLKLFKRYVNKDKKILEIGSNVGRNLKYLEDCGYKNLMGLEINAEAVKNKICKSNIICSSVEDYFSKSEIKYDVIYTMACFEHVHYDSDWVFEHIERATDTIITIEDEKERAWNHFVRNYKKVFKNKKQIYRRNNWNIKGLNRNFITRMFINI